MGSKRREDGIKYCRKFHWCIENAVSFDSSTCLASSVGQTIMLGRPKCPTKYPICRDGQGARHGNLYWYPIASLLQMIFRYFCCKDSGVISRSCRSAGPLAAMEAENDSTTIHHSHLLYWSLQLELYVTPKYIRPDGSINIIFFTNKIKVCLKIIVDRSGDCISSKCYILTCYNRR